MTNRMPGHLNNASSNAIQFISFHFSSYRQNQSDGSCHRARNIFWRRDFESPMFAHPSVASYSREGGPFFLAPISIQSEERGKDCCSPVLHTVPDIYTHTHTTLTHTHTDRTTRIWRLLVRRLAEVCCGEGLIQ